MAGPTTTGVESTGGVGCSSGGSGVQALSSSNRMAAAKLKPLKYSRMWMRLPYYGEIILPKCLLGYCCSVFYPRCVIRRLINGPASDLGRYRSARSGSETEGPW